MSIRVGIVGISGFGGGEAMRLVASHPSFELVYAAGEGSAGSHLVDRFPGVPAKLAELVIEKWDPVTLPKLECCSRRGRAFVRVTDKPPQTKWASGSNFAFISYAADP